MVDSPELEAAIWSIADGRSADEDVALLHADERASLRMLDRLIVDVARDLDSARSLDGDERDQVVADLAETLDSLRGTAARLRPEPPPPPAPARAAVREPEPEPEPLEPPEPDEVQLQASWSSGRVVVWASARGAVPESHEDLSRRLEAIGGPPLGWELHAPVPLPGGARRTRWRSRPRTPSGGSSP